MRRNDDGAPSPDAKTYGTLINVLSHCGEFEEANYVWKNQIDDDEIKYDEYVVTSLINGMSQRGKLKQAYDMIIKHDFNHKPMWLSLLNGCRIHQNKNFGNRIYKEIKNRFNNDNKVMKSANALISSINKQTTIFKVTL